ncbi:MAG: haloacid dehalogenase type II [Desulfuromonadaceae bacterium]|nr:haloacid dehalogenase type II [Desulfuromonadaceae bacterium]MDD2849089.1 haloacid dehalogenase type II [Desulfuromonadaceae bacterium]MDD4131753.1 haloacid dehalogenase type II [Desulfuromonadaceae bacterium]
MAVTLAFDVYGTLINTHGVVVALEKYVGSKAPAFSSTWREKQLEYSFRRGLMQNYEDFAHCTSNALDYTSSYYDAALTQFDKEKLLDAYRVLPAFDDVREGLVRAQKAGFRMFAFSNGSAATVETLLKHAGIREFFIGVVSVDEMKSFKPNPAVYSHFLRRAGAVGADAWLISSNPFDVIGAISAGMRAAWLKRSPDALFDPWGIEPTLTLSSLVDLDEQIAR